MRLYEFEGKRLLSRVGINLPEGKVVVSSRRTGKSIEHLLPVMAKAQVLWGRRGKAGGVLTCETKEQVKKAIDELLQKKLFGESVKKVLIERKLETEKESFLSLTYQDRKPVIIASSRGA